VNHLNSPATAACEAKIDSKPLFDRKLLAYAAAAGAVVAGGQGANAIVSTRAIGVTVDSTTSPYALFVDDDATADFEFTFGNEFIPIGIVPVSGVKGLGTNTVAGFVNIEPKATRLTGSSHLPDDYSFISGSAKIAVSAPDPFGGEFGPGDSGYLGLAFDISGDTHYGFALIDVNNDFTTTIQSVSWETQAGAAIHVPSPIPEPIGLGALAIGAAGLGSLRRRRA
jgi:hypothetical protein